MDCCWWWQNVFLRKLNEQMYSTGLSAAAGEANGVQIQLHRRLRSPMTSNHCVSGNETQPLKWGNTINIYFPWNNIKRRVNAPWPCLQCFHADAMVSNQFGWSRNRFGRCWNVAEVLVDAWAPLVAPKYENTADFYRQTNKPPPSCLTAAFTPLIKHQILFHNPLWLGVCGSSRAWRSHCSPHVHPTWQP